MDRIRRILLAVRGGALPADALARAAHLGDEVNVLHVVDEDGRSESDFVSAVATHARVVGAELIVLAPEDAASGSAVTGLVHASGLPVLLARAARASNIVAATDLTDADFPIVRRASALASQLGMTLVALHSFDPSTADVAAGTPRACSPSRAGFEQAREERLDLAVASAGANARPVMRSGMDAARVILEEARVLNADLVVVGVRKRGWLDRLLGTSVARTVVDGSRRSVLVAPLASS